MFYIIITKIDTMKTIEIDVEIDEIALKESEDHVNAQVVAKELMQMVGYYLQASYPGVEFRVIVHDTFNEPIN